ncbi:MAG: TatD family deoxyribonuclease [Gammaproteobacteria bacterium]|nr:MAG: TatD family deoxyribonuclease [Gammaproteobacteria bacterium]
MNLVDSHCHIDVPDFDPDRTEVLERARQAGVSRIVVPAIDARGWPHLAKTCRAHPGLYPAFGLHPLFLSRHAPGDEERIGEWIEREGGIAVGECGLDYWIEDPDHDAQRRLFEAQLRIARDLGLPVIIHCRKALDEVLMLWRRIRPPAGVLHAFSGSDAQARRALDMDLRLGIGGPVTYPRARRLRSQAATLPLDALLLETDAPDQPLQGRQGQRNEPACVRDICETVAGLRDLPPGEVAAATTAAAEALFRLPPVAPA